MVIGILVSGIVSGLVAAIGSLTLGFPIWGAILLYPLAGSIGAIGFVTLAMSRVSYKAPQSRPAFATDAR